MIDAKLTFAGSMPPFTEPSVEPGETGGPRVLKNPPGYVDEVPSRIVNLDREATGKITDKWAIDSETKKAIREGAYSWQ
ncbi:MAG: hypothetical protein JXA49_04115 [Actinobacteria bacterium]|nr:hypothetical protein [Actinomycetota bacterium]